MAFGPTLEPIMTSPYDGALFNVTLHNNGVWGPEDLFNPRQPFDTEEIAIRKLCLVRNGIARQKPSYTCPYSGKRFTIQQHPTTKRWHGVGLFNPYNIYSSKEACNFALSTRGGRKPKFSDKPLKITSSGVIEPAPPSTVDKKGDLGDLTEEFIDSFHHKLKEK